MGSMTNYLETQVLNATLRGIAYTAPTAVYIALFTSDPTETGSAGTEVTGGGYARQPVTFSAPIEEGGKTVTKNSTDVLFPVATVAYGVVTYFAIYDALTTGNSLYHGALATPKDIQVGDRLVFVTNNLVIDID